MHLLRFSLQPLQPLPPMELLALRWVLLAGTLLSTSATSSALRQRDLSPITLQMDMALNSFDDQYNGCEDKMKARLPELNRREIAMNSIYAATWKKASAEWQQRCRRLSACPQLTQDQAIAVLAYTDDGGMSQQFNKATREGGRSRHHYLNSYHFKVLHFLLTQALQALQRSQPGCHDVYRGVEGIHFTATIGTAVRFGQFTSTSLWKNVTKKFGQDTFFVVNTCYGVPIMNLSYFKNQSEVLIPPFEVFEVTDFTRINGKPQIQLRSKGKESNHNCELVKEVGLGHSPGLALHSLPCCHGFVVWLSIFHIITSFSV